jgi:hypothetical protein
MKEKTVVTILAIIAILLVCSLVAIFYLSQVTEVEQVPEPPRGDMAIYQNGLISLSYTKEVETSNPIILLPEGVMLDSIRIENVSGFREIKDSEHVHIETDMGDYTGKLLEENEDFIMIEVENRTVAIEKSRIKLYTQEPEKGVSIELFLNETNESRIKVSISYIIWGEPWYLNYDIDIESKVLQAETSVKSPVNVKNVDISLISGSPHIVSWYAEKLDAQRGAPAVLKEMMISEGAREGEYYVYEIENATLKKDVLNVFKRFDSTIDLEKFYYWNSGMVEERLNIRNNLEEPLPEGRVDFYSNGEWIGEDVIAYLAEGRKTNLTVRYSQDLKFLKNLTYTKHEAKKHIYEYTIKVQSNKNETVKIVVEQTLERNANLLSTSPKASVEGNRITWELEIGPKTERTLRYRYEVIEYRG